MKKISKEHIVRKIPRDVFNKKNSLAFRNYEFMG